MKINCYICTTVVSLPSHTFSRDPSSFPPLHPFFQWNEKPFHPPPPPPFPPPLPPRHLFDSLSKVHNPPYLSISALPPTLPPEAASSTRFNLRLVPVVSLEQSIPISRESVLNLAPSRVSRLEMDLSIPSFSTIVARGIRFIWMDPFMRG